MWQLPNGIFNQDPDQELTGELALGVAVSGGKSIATSQYNHRALKIIRPHYLDDSGQVYYTIVNPGGGYVGGDAYQIKVDVAEGASLLLTDQSATKVYRTPDNYVTQNIEFSVADGGVLEYVPDQLILYRDADFRQHITARVHPGGSLLISDLVTPGWSPEGEPFLYRQAHLRNEVFVGEELALIDNIKINPKADQVVAERDFLLGGRSHISTVICFDPKIDQQLVDEIAELITEHSGGEADLLGSVTQTDRPGFVLRALANRTEELLGLTLATANLLRAKLRGQRDIQLRKY